MIKVELSYNFRKEAKQLIKKYRSLGVEIAQLIHQLTENPFEGESLGKDCYKIRIAIASKGKGKSGGGRIISCVKVTAEKVILLSIYDKSEQEDIGDNFLKQLLKENNLI
jgi:mRNA-degrading endonuclease RelE of RelBE toxin-antitoxin system